MNHILNNISEEEKYYLNHIDGKYPEALWSKFNKEKLNITKKSS